MRDLPKGPAGSVQVEVRFTVDADGILHVDVTERTTTGKSTSTKVLASSGLARSERLASVHRRTGASRALGET